MILDSSQGFLANIAGIVFTRISMGITRRVTIPRQTFFALPSRGSITILIGYRGQPRPITGLTFSYVVGVGTYVVSGGVPIPTATIKARTHGTSRFFTMFQRMIFRDRIRFGMEVGYS